MRARLALERPLAKRLQPEALAQQFRGTLADQDLAGLRLHHQARGHVRLVAQHAVGAPRAAAVRADAHRPLADAKLHLLDERKGGWAVAQFQRRCRRALRVVVVRDRRAEGSIEIAALVARRQLDQRTGVACQHLLHPANIAVQMLAGGGVLFKIEPGKAHEECGGRAQLGQEALFAGRQVGPDCRQ